MVNGIITKYGLHQNIHSLGINTDIWSIVHGRGLVMHCYKQRGPSLQIPMTITTKNTTKQVTTNATKCHLTLCFWR